ncbi:MAG TPA: hypothetical protein VFA15_04235, partial [Nitrososphaera sp.]|nr:hypothetical protein [Nitrososphaera sp.]
SPTSLYSRQSLWGTGDPSQAVNVRITAVAPGKSDEELIYVVSTDSVGGLFRYDTKNKKETREFHKEKLYLSDISRQPGGDLLLCCRKQWNGTASIAVVKGNDVDELTEGDSVDEAPSWVPIGNTGPSNGDGAVTSSAIVYQSAGVARNQSGVMMGIGPCRIEKLNIATGSLETLLESESIDYLSPRMNSEGDLFVIKRPYETPFKKSYPIHKQLLDILLFPFRLLRAFFHFLNFMSLTFSKTPLTTASGPKVEGPDEKTLFLKGRIIDAEEFLKEQQNKNEAPSLVPKNWQLMRRSRDGRENVLADSVLSFDLAADGTLVYTNGICVYQMKADGSERQLLFKDKLVDTIVLI